MVYFTLRMMLRIVLSVSLFCQALGVMAQEKFVPHTRTIRHKIGEDHARIQLMEYGTRRDIVFINLHADETTSVEAAQQLLETKGGVLIRLDNESKRNIRFRIKKQIYTFDPNRIFSRQGIERTLTRFQNISPKAIAAIEKFAGSILSLIPKDAGCIIALHNNTEGNLSVNSYLPGNIYASDAQEVHVADTQDPDDFFLTTDSLLFHQLSSENYNTVWQDNLRVQQDGSLSVYFGELNICYLNCETQHGKHQVYRDMLSTALQLIEERKSSRQAVNR